MQSRDLYDSEVPYSGKISGENYVTSARSLKYHNEKKFQTQDICWVSAGVSADVSADDSEGLKDTMVSSGVDVLQ